MILIYIPSFARTQLYLPPDQASSRNRSAWPCQVVLIPICGVSSDRTERKPVMTAALGLGLVVT